MQSINRLIDKSKNSLAAFTLIELMLVMAIMGLLGTISIGGFRAMRRGMEQSSVMRNLDQFVHNAYLRAAIDRQPTVVYFWNETRREESDTESILVVGRAVAVRRAGRISAKDGSYLVDEFGDSRYSRATDEDGKDATDEDEVKNGIKMYLYKMNGDESGGVSDNRSEVSQATLYRGQNIGAMMTDSGWSTDHSGDNAAVTAYGWYTEDIGEWQVGDAYGLEFAEITLPNNYIFGTVFSKKVSDPVEEVSTAIRCWPDKVSGSVEVCVIRPGDDGSPKATSFNNNRTSAANGDLLNKNY